MKKKKRGLSKKRIFIVLVAVLLILFFIFYFLKGKVKSDVKEIVLGNSYIIIPKNARVGVQVDRVIRNIAKQRWDENMANASQVPNSPDEVIRYMEGARVREMMKYADITVVPLTPCACKIKKKEKLCYAKDGEGNYRFLVDPSKIDYRTAIKTSDGYILPDTHGINMVAEQAVKEKPFLVIGCGDLGSKAEAALYLAEKGINVYMPCDRFAYLNLGHEAKGKIIGTAPIRKHENGAIIGNQKVKIKTDEIIIVQYTTKPYPDQYCDTPWRYFNELNNKYRLGLKLVEVYANVGETKKVVEKARELEASVIGVRVSIKEDTLPVREWLSENKERRAILFHSVYRRGNKLFFDFPDQTSFGDLHPVFIQ